MGYTYKITPSSNRRTSSTQEVCWDCQNARHVAYTLKKLTPSSVFDVWQIGADGGQEKKVLASVPGQSGSQDWFPFKYSPLPKDTPLSGALPTGYFYDIQNMTGEIRQKPAKWKKNEIDQILINEDLSIEELNTSMRMLSDQEMLYSYLESRGQMKALQRIKLLLSY